MKKFLEQVAEDFAGRSDLRNLCFVFPNRRSSIFFQRYLGKAAGKALFSPSLKTIDELFADLSSLRRTDKIKALSVLYRCYSKLISDRGLPVEPFDEFIFWGDILLSDFDDMDKYLVDVDRLLVNIKDLKDLSAGYDFLSEDQKLAIEVFCHNFRPEETHEEEPQDKKRMFSETWNLLQPLYHSFNDALKAEGEGYGGMIYRQVADNPNLTALNRYDEIVFVGLNALNKCEIKLLDALKVEGKADFYWDFQGPMVKDKANKSVKFIGANVERYPSRVRHPEQEMPAQNINVVSVPSAVGQTRVAADVIRSLFREGKIADPVETAVVLPDETLLFPMLGDVPSEVERINITMGYALSASNVAGFFSILERLQTNVRMRNGEACYYHRDVMDLLEHPYLMSAEKKAVIDEFKAEIRRTNRIFVRRSALPQDGCEVWPLVFRVLDDSSQIPGYQCEVIDYFQGFLEGGEKEFLYRYRLAVDRLSSLSEDIDLKNLKAKTYYKLLGQYVSLISVPYQGEPLDGIQIMGPLETRALDFKNIIMLSVSEGSFPSKNVSASFIPYNLRVGFDMPTYEFQDSIWAYHFYRSICRAENVWLIYDSRTEGLQSGEESRYIKQLKYHFNVPVKEYVASYSLGDTMQIPSLEIVKTPEVIKLLRDRFMEKKEGSFSASSLNSYLDCSLKWYYAEVECIREEDDVTEEIDAGLFGTIYHGVMERIYKPLENQVLSAIDIESIRKDRKALEKIAAETFEEEAHLDAEDLSGRNLIFRNIVLKYVARTLEIDAGSAPLVVSATEAPFKKDWTVAGGTVRLKGRIDRMDSIAHGIRRVIDYKSGSVGDKAACGNVEAIFDRTNEKRPSIALQLYFYLLLLDEENCDSTTYQPCIYGMKELFKELPEPKVITREQLELFKEKLTETIAEIFDPNVPFTASAADPSGWNSPCKYCDFKRLCHR